MSLYLSLKLTTNWVSPFENKTREIYFLWRSVFCFVLWSSFIIFDYVLGWVCEEYTTVLRHDKLLLNKELAQFNYEIKLED